MNKKVIIAELISTDIRSRSYADKIRNEVTNSPMEVILDFSRVSFISRSFTDELYNIIDESKNTRFQMTNMSKIVRTMTEVVKKSRGNDRIRLKDNSEIKEFDDIQTLLKYFSMM